MVAIEQNKDHRSSWGKKEQSILGKCIGMKATPAIFDSDLNGVLMLLWVEGRKTIPGLAWPGHCRTMERDQHN